MEEFLKLKWKTEGLHDLECGPEFIPEEEILNSYIYKERFTNGIENPIKVETKKAPEKPNLGKKYKLKCKIKSFLDADEQSRCLNALHILQTGKRALSIFDKKCVELYNNVQQKLAEENKKFSEFAKNNFLNKSIKAGFTKTIQTYTDAVLKKQLERCTGYPQYYKEIDTVLYCFEEHETPIEMVHLANLLELGSLAKFTRPSLLTPYHVTSYNLPNTFETYYSNLPVSKDVNAKKLVESHEAEVVISSSGLKKLLNFTEINSSWDIPVLIEEINLTKNNGTVIRRNVIFIDKPLPNITPTRTNVIQRALKQGLKSNFCTTEALRYIGIEKPINATCQEEDTANNSNCKNYHNATYRMWHLRQESKPSELMKSHYKMKDIKVLVRCKLDSCEPLENFVLQPLTLYPKLEQQPEFGAAIPSKAELVSQWASIFFRPYSQVCRVRIACTSKEVLMLENCNIQKINNELHTHYNYKPSLGLGVLYKLFLELKTLSPGSYLLRHLPKHGTFVSLLQSCDKEGIYDLYDKYNVDNWKIDEKNIEWCPIDCCLILPKHFAFRHMPGLFPPGKKVIKTSKFIPANKNQSKKGKRKNGKHKSKLIKIIMKKAPTTN